MAVMESTFVINDKQFILQMDAGASEQLKHDKEYAKNYIRQLVESGCLTEVGIGASEQVAACTCFLGMPEEFEINFISQAEPSPEPTQACNAEGESSWSKDAVRLLIETRHQMDAVFEKPPCTKAKLWVRVAQKLQEVGGYHYSGEEVDGKWKSLLRTYRINLDKANKSGESALTWEYFHLMNELFGKKSSSNPPESQLQSSTLIKKPETTPKRSATTPQGPPCKRKSQVASRNLPEEAPAWFTKFLVDKKEADERFLEEQRKSREVEEAKLKLLRDLLQKGKD